MTPKLRIAVLVGLLAIAGAHAQDVRLAPPPQPYVNASTLLPLPDFIPDAGALYIDPANAPLGPWLAYGNDGRLVDILFMVPLAQLDAYQSLDDLGHDVLEQLGMTHAHIDHIDLSYNGGHPGLAEPHYHVRLSLLPHDQQVADLRP